MSHLFWPEGLELAWSVACGHPVWSYRSCASAQLGAELSWCGGERDVGPDRVTSTGGEQSGDLVSLADIVLTALNTEQWQTSPWISF